MIEDNEDFIEKPGCRILFRQSSLETRLSPVHLSEESNSEDEDEKVNVKIVDYKMKSGNLMEPPSVGQGNTTEKVKFREELQSKLNKSFSNKKLGGTPVAHEPQHATSSEKTNFDSKVMVPHINSAFKNELNRKFEEDQQKNKLEEKSAKPFVPKKPQKNNDNDETREMSNIMENLIDTSMDNSKSKIIEENIIRPAESSSDVLKMKTSEESDDVNTSVGFLKALNVTKKEENTEEMATARPKSPRPVSAKGEKDESIWDKLGTLGRKKRIKEVQEVQAEGKYAIDSPGCPTAPVIPPEEYNLDDNEERCMIDRRAYDDPKFIELLNILKEWINDELASQRIIVQDLSEDLYDGQVLQKLLEKLTGDKLDVPEVTQSEEGQKQKLSVVLGHFNQVLGIQRISHNKWSVEAIHSKNIVAITHLLVALARHFRPPVRLPEHVSVDVVVVQKVKGVLNHKVIRENLTKTYDDVGMRCERDAFDTLFDHAPDKLQVVKKSLVTFVNKHLNKMNFEVTEIESQFHDGVYLIMLMGLLEGFFVPHYNFHLTPHEFDQKVHNVNFAFFLMEEVGLQKPKARPEDVVNMDLKSTLRVLYNLFLKYKTIL